MSSRMLDRRRKSGSLMGGAISLGLGSAAGQVLVLATMPLLSRVYGPEAYGSLAIVATSATLFSVGAAGRYDIAMLLPRRNETASLLLRLSFLCIAATAVLSAVAVFALRDRLAAAFSDPLLAPLLWWVPLLVITMGGYEAFSNWLTRLGAFSGIARARVVRAFGTVASQVAMGMGGLGALGLVGGQALGQLSSVAIFGWAATRTGLPLMGGRAGVRRLAVVASRYRDFPRFNVPQAILDAASQQLPVLLLGGLFGTGPAGWFWFTHRIFQFGTELFGQSVRQVYFHEIAGQARSSAELRPFFRKVSVGLLLFSAVPGLVICFWGPAIFSVAFGAEWLEAGEYARWLALAWVMVMVTQPSIAMVFTLELQRGQLLWEAAMFVGRLVGLLVGASLAGARGAVAGYAVTTAAGGAILAFWVDRAVFANDTFVGQIARSSTR